MTQVGPNTSTWTAVDLVHRFGPIPLSRVVRDPAPGTATVADVVRLDAHEDRLCELIDGTLVEKVMGAYESFLASRLIMLLGNALADAELGIVLGEAGMMEVLPGQVHIPDVAYVSWERLRKSSFPESPVPILAPDLAVEVVSKNNTKEEMERKLCEYFEAGVRLVWYVYPESRQVRVYRSADDLTTLGESETLTGGEVLPGLAIDLKAFFTLPTPK